MGLSQVVEIVKGIDTDGSGTIDKEEWETGIVLAKYKIFLQLAMANNYLESARFACHSPLALRPSSRRPARACSCGSFGTWKFSAGPPAANDVCRMHSSRAHPTSGTATMSPLEMATSPDAHARHFLPTSVGGNTTSQVPLTARLQFSSPNGRWIR